MINAFQVVKDFEQALAEFSGSRFAVTTDSCSNALFLCCLYRKVTGLRVTLPARTYPSAPLAVIHAGGTVVWSYYSWTGAYDFSPFSIIDGAKRFRRLMYRNTFPILEDRLHCLSFHSNKRLPIGRGGAILTNSKDAYEWLKLMRFDGREECSLTAQQSFSLPGWNFYMTPEQAARGLLLLQNFQGPEDDLLENPPYPDLSTHPAFSTGGPACG